MQNSLETPTSSESPILSPRNAEKKKNFFGKVGGFPFGKKKPMTSNSSSQPDSPLPLRARLPRIKDFALYHPEKDMWLEPEKEISFYCFVDGTTLEFKRRIRDFKLRMQYEVKILFPNFGWTKFITISPSTTTVLQLREQIIQWLKNDNLWNEIPSFELDDHLSQFGIYLHNSKIDDEEKVLSTYYLKQKDIIEIKQNPGFAFEAFSSSNSSFLLFEEVDATFQSLINKIKLIEKINNDNNENNKFEVILNSPLGNLDSFNIGLSRALLKTGESFTISCPIKKWSLIIKKVPKDTILKIDSRIPSHILIEGEKIHPQIFEHVTVFYHLKGVKDIVKYSASVMVTNYRILISRKFQGGSTPKIEFPQSIDDDWAEIPLTSIASIIKLKRNFKIQRKYCVEIYCKSIRKITLGFNDNEQKKFACSILNECISKHSRSDLFAFYYKNEYGLESNVQKCWDIYDAKSEFARMGIFLYGEDRFGWRFTNVNSNYELSPSYPSVIVVPASVSDDIVRATSSFRTKSRIPALVWIHPITGVCLCR